VCKNFLYLLLKKISYLCPAAFFTLHFKPTKITCVLLHIPFCFQPTSYFHSRCCVLHSKFNHQYLLYTAVHKTFHPRYCAFTLLFSTIEIVIPRCLVTSFFALLCVLHCVCNKNKTIDITCFNVAAYYIFNNKKLTLPFFTAM